MSPNPCFVSSNTYRTKQIFGKLDWSTDCHLGISVATLTPPMLQNLSDFHIHKCGRGIVDFDVGKIQNELNIKGGGVGGPPQFLKRMNFSRTL